MALEVVDVNGLATLQDLGRFGWRRFGVSACGPMDAFAFRAANALAGNAPNATLIELGLGDLTLRAQNDCVIAMTGAGYAASIYVWDFALWSSYYVRAGWTIRLRKTDGGMWSYLAIAGGMMTSPVLDSNATDLRGRFGGLGGRALQVGDRIECGKPTRAFDELAARSIPRETHPAYAINPIIDIVPGPQQDFFTGESMDTLLSSQYHVTLKSDRTGYRLDGPPLSRRDERELISEGMTPGTIEVPPDGRPIVMMADCPTAGGYPKIGTVISADLPLLAQCTPQTSRLQFRTTTVPQAHRKYRALISRLQGSIIGPSE